MRAVLLGLLLCVVSATNAATINPNLAKYDPCGRYELHSINGILTDLTGATQNLDRLRTVYGNSYDGHLIAYRVAFNQTRGLPVDFVDSALQVMTLYAGATWDMWMNAVTFGIYDAVMPTATAQAIAKAVTDQYGFTRPAPYEDQDIADIVSSIRNQTDSGAKLLMVGHSQGSIYLTLVYNKLIALGWKPQTIGAVGIAVAYSSIPTGNAYTTSANDVVIDAVRIATAGKILRPTLSNRYRPSIDPLGHNLRETYLHDLNPRSIDQIKDNISAEFQTIKTSLPKTKWSDTVYNSLQWFEASPENPQYRGPNNSIKFETPFYQYATPGSTTNEWRYVTGSSLQASDQAKLNASTCYSLTLAKQKERRAVGDFNYYFIPGCWLNAYDVGGAWQVYSGDGPAAGIETTWYEVGSQFTTTMATTCRGI